MPEKDMNKSIERPPVVVIMGHIDHGKSTLLDFIRKSNVVGGEAGGITQHIAAYEIEHTTENGKKKITFLDTPGHEAFFNVRDRGAKVADISILIVSAEDAVMPQTKEALKSILKAKVPFIVAINKIDSPKANIERTKQSLAENEVYLEGYGGHTPVVNISAKTGENVNELLDMVLLVAELEEFKADPKADASGYVLEAHKDKSRGISATLLIKDGTLETGMFVAGEQAMSPVRTIYNYKDEQIKEASFSSPITISGWTEIPPPGSKFLSFKNKKEAEEYCKGCTPDKKFISRNLEVEEGVVVLPLIIKTDVHGTVEAIQHELSKIDNDLVKFNVIETGSGNISENDMKLAVGNPETIIIGFNVKIDNQAEALRERDNIQTKTFTVIYEIVDWLKEVAEQKRPFISIEEVKGRAKILRVFNKNKNLQVIGGKVKEGTLSVGDKVKIMRRDEVIDRGVIKEMQQSKAKTDSVSEGTEFGAAIEVKMEIAESDFIEAIKMVRK